MNPKLPTDTILYLIEKAIKSYRRFAQNNIHQKVRNITIDQALLLILLQNRPELTQIEMADLLFKDYASITRMIELLVKKNYLTRNENPKDRRRKELTISSEGEETLKKIFPIIEENRKIALNGLSTSELSQLDHLLRKIINNCR